MLRCDSSLSRRSSQMVFSAGNTAPPLSPLNTRSWASKLIRHLALCKAHVVKRGMRAKAFFQAQKILPK